MFGFNGASQELWALQSFAGERSSPLQLRVLEIKRVFLLYCREAMFGASPIRQTLNRDNKARSPFLCETALDRGASAPLIIAFFLIVVFYAPSLLIGVCAIGCFGWVGLIVWV